MLSTYQYPKFAYRRAAEIGQPSRGLHPVIVVGAGPVGLCAAIECKLAGIPVIVVDEDDTVSVGSRGVCYAKRTLEILDRLGCGDPITNMGVNWNVGRTFFHEREVYQFNLVPEPDHKRPGMVNLQQYHLEQTLVERANALGIDLRWKNKVTQVVDHGDRVALTIDTPDGTYELGASWLVVADGARSPIRKMMGLEVDGKIFMDRFLIADVVMKADFPTERWFWFDPPFHRNQSVLLHKQADNVWRIDFQLGWDVDPEEEKKPEKVTPRIRAMLGEAHPFELEWVSIYTFQCRRMGKFRHGRTLFVGDAAHQVSPFGARGANSGIQDTDNLGWKLKLVVDGKAPERLLDTYSDERVFAADENIMNSTRSTDFITPKSPISRVFRDAVLDLAEHVPFSRKLVNSGRLSVPSFYTESSLNSPDEPSFAGSMVPGAPMDDAPLEVAGATGWLLDHVGQRFILLVFATQASELDVPALCALRNAAIPIEPMIIAPSRFHVENIPVAVDLRGRIAKRYDAKPETAYLIRPDQHVVARWRRFEPAAVARAQARATANS